VVQVERRAPVAPAPVPEPVDDDGEWETLILAAKSRAASTLVRTPPPVRLTTVARDSDHEERAWEEMIARAKRRPTSAPVRAPAARRHPGEETGDWSAVIAAAKLRHQLHDRA
jgi:hypothetical protein